MAFDVKKEYKDLYQPAATPSIIEVPRMRSVAVEGSGDPNEEDGDYQTALQLLYGVSFTIKMSRKSKDPAEHIEGYYDYVVPPLEGLWHMDTNDNETGAIDYSRKTDFQWTSMIRLPEFVTDEAFDACVSRFAAKHPEMDVSRVFLLDWTEGLAGQVMHKGSYDNEPATIATLDQHIAESGHHLDFDSANRRLHHEIYLGDPRKSKPENLRTVIRHPIV